MYRTQAIHVAERTKQIKPRPSIYVDIKMAISSRHVWAKFILKPICLSILSQLYLADSQYDEC